jgi:hypothetical protein
MAERPAPVARLLDETRSLDRAYSAGHHGRWSAARRAELVDTCLCELFDGAEAPEGVALVALGGYGRGELLPASDVDLLILHDGGDPPATAALAERILYPLWDAGMAVGHGVRTNEESLALAADRLDVTEELVRLRSHAVQFRGALAESAEGGVGRRLEFLLQEMLRETNTVGSKAADAPVAHLVVDLKGELERTREQVLNVE